MVPYVGGNSTTPKKWVGLIVDFGVQVQGDGYTVMPEDYVQAARWGATTDTAFVLWVTTDYARTIRFINTSNTNSTVAFTIYFEEDMPLSLSNVSSMNVTTGWQTGDNEGIRDNADKFTVTKKDGNTIVINDTGFVPYVGGWDSNNAHKWYGFIVDFGVRVDGVGGYGIEDVDRTDAARWGATSETAFIMWLNENEAGTYKFKDASNNIVDLTVIIEQGAPEQD